LPTVPNRQKPFWEMLVATPRAKHGSFKEQWFGPITPDNVEAVIGDLTKGWYVLGVLVLVAQSYLAWVARIYSANLFDGFLYLIGGYYLIRRKSRSLAAALLAYALLVGAITFLGRFRVISPQGGTNIILAVMAIIIAWRGCRATFVYQRKVGHRASWKHVIWIWLSFILLEAIVFLAAIIAVSMFPQINDDALVGQVTVTVMAVCAIVYFIPLTRRYPFHRPAERTA
jgi:hypothetical protein